MELRQFYNRPINPIVRKSFACKWSEDNRISVVTEKGVHVFEIIFSPAQANPILKIIRTFINSPETLPGEIYKDQIQESIIKWNKEDVYSFFMHSSYLPNFPKASKVIPEIVDFFWSPQGLLVPQKCIAALLTSTGAVELTLQIDRNWITVFEFTPVWAKVVNDDPELLNCNSKTDAEFFKQKLDRLLMTSATWSSLKHEYNDKCYAYFVTGHSNSEIVVWKVYGTLCDTLNEAVSLNAIMKFNKKLIEESLKIHSLLWIDLNENNYYLIVGFFNGQIGALKLQKFEEELTSEFYSTFFCEADSIPVDSLSILRSTDEWVEIVVVKGMYLKFCTLNMQGKMIDMKFICSPGFSITGFSDINTNLILITTQNGKIYSIKRGNNQELTYNQVNLNGAKNNLQYLGLASSSNRMLFSFITSPSMMYDHLIIREPSDINFFCSYGVPTLDPVDILYKEQSLSKTWDCLELIKILALKYNELPKILPKIDMNIELLSLHELRIAYWIMVISETLKNKNSSETRKPHADVEKSRYQIFLFSTVDQLNRLALQGSLSQVQKLSMSLMRNHLEIWLAGEEEEAETNLLEKVNQALEVTCKFDLIEQENCSLCNTLIIEPWASTCSVGHYLPRCAITSLQVTSLEFRTCTICEEIFHPSLDEEMSEVICPYCDKPALYTKRIFNPLFLASNKNLSKKRFITSKETKEDGTKENEAEKLEDDISENLAKKAKIDNT